MPAWSLLGGAVVYCVVDVSSLTSLLTACANTEHMDQARVLFDRMSHMNDVAWRAMLSAYAAADSFRSAMQTFENMLRSCICLIATGRQDLVACSL